MIDHSRHVPLRDVPWDPGAAEEAIAEIAADALAHFGSHPFWPGHPLDDARRHSGIYYGATGVVWGLNYLRRIGAIKANFDFKPHLPQLLANIQADMTAYGDYAAHGCLLAGDMGTALVAMRPCAVYRHGRTRLRTSRREHAFAHTGADVGHAGLDARMPFHERDDERSALAVSV
jgi:hypothetical protein